MILLVEDEPFVRETTCSILQSAGFDVLPAPDASTALQLYEDRPRPIDLIMTDMVLPGRSGKQLGDDLRQRSPEIAVLITSGYGNLEYEQLDREQKELGSRTHFLAKPYSRRTLVEKIEKILGGAPRARPATQAG